MVKASELNIPDKNPEVKPYHGWTIPVCSPFYFPQGKEAQHIQQALESNWISGGGAKLDEFEKLFAKKTGAQFGIACNSGTSALTVGYRLLGIAPGDEVIVPTFTMVSTVTPLIDLGATPVFVDCDEFGQIDVTKIEAKITDKTKAIVGVHIYGHPVNIEELEKIAIKHSLKVLYDAAESHGAQFKGQPIGKFGDVVCYSFYANKIITTGEGGMITVNSPDLMREARKLIDEYISSDRHFWHESYGYSYRMSNLLAAIGLGQTETLELAITAHRDHQTAYKALLDDVPGISFLPEHKDVSAVNWMHCILVDKEKFGMDRNELRTFLASRGIETRTLFIPMHVQPVMQRLFGESQDEFPVADKLCREGLYLPSSSGLADRSLLYITDRIREAYDQARKGEGKKGGAADGATVA